MKILLISYSDIEYDGRLRELKKICQKIGDVYTVIKNNRITSENDYGCLGKGIGQLGFFLKKCIQICRNEKIDIVFLDNRMACIPGLIIKYFFRNIIFIQDVRELYLLKERKGLKSKIGCLIETGMMKKSDIVIAANSYRASYMKKTFLLNEMPLVYENLRKLEYEENFNRRQLDEKYSYIEKKGRKIIISTAGVDINRTTDRLVKEIGKYSDKYVLLLVGGGTVEDEKQISSILKEFGYSNVYLIGRVCQNELKYLINMADIGVVNYGMYDTNNIYCASGKVFEFIYEGKPVITTCNPPLIDLCNEYKIGCYGESYIESANMVIDNYSSFLDNINRFCQEHLIEDANEELALRIEEQLRKISR